MAGSHKCASSEAERTYPASQEPGLGVWMPDLSAPTKRHGNSQHEAEVMPSVILGHQLWSSLRETSSRGCSVLVNGWTGDLSTFSGVF